MVLSDSVSSFLKLICFDHFSFRLDSTRSLRIPSPCSTLPSPPTSLTPSPTLISTTSTRIPTVHRPSEVLSRRSSTSLSPPPSLGRSLRRIPSVSRLPKPRSPPKPRNPSEGTIRNTSKLSRRSDESSPPSSRRTRLSLSLVSL